MQRDRNREGRPQQARPRDRLGRPLPYGTPGVEPVPEGPLSSEQALGLARRLLGEGRAFGAHEVLEARWKCCPAGERDLWQGLAQLCVALTHAERGNQVGAERLLARGREHLRVAQAEGQLPAGVDPAALIAWASEPARALRLPPSLPL